MRGIYLVANKTSQFQCEILVKSIRENGCHVPITLIHFGGNEITSAYLLQNTQLKLESDFCREGLDLVNALSEILQCPRGFLLRFLAYFGEHDEFIYSDNDILALSNWNDFFDKLENYDFVHADEEYKTEGIFNFKNTEAIKNIFGKDALNSCITAGHFCTKKDNTKISDFYKAIQWFNENPKIPKKHDQALIILALLIGNWKVLNLCKQENYLSSWASDYTSSLDLILKIKQNPKITHLHYSGKTFEGLDNIDDLWTSYLTANQRLTYYFKLTNKYFGGYFLSKKYLNKIKNKINLIGKK